MYEARITYWNGNTRIIEANTIEMLKDKCKNLIANERVVDIWIVEIKGIGWLKSAFGLELI